VEPVSFWLLLAVDRSDTKRVELAVDCLIMVGNTWIWANPVIRVYWVILLATRHHYTLSLRQSYQPFHTTVSTMTSKLLNVLLLSQLYVGEAGT